MSRRASQMTYYASDSDIRDLQRIFGVSITPRCCAGPVDRNLDYAMRVTANCPCDSCLQRKTCAEECVLFVAWVKRPDRGGGYAAPAS